MHYRKHCSDESRGIVESRHRQSADKNESSNETARKRMASGNGAQNLETSKIGKSRSGMAEVFRLTAKAYDFLGWISGRCRFHPANGGGKAKKSLFDPYKQSEIGNKILLARNKC